jgi:hypothetical protein
MPPIRGSDEQLPALPGPPGARCGSAASSAEGTAVSRLVLANPAWRVSTALEFWLWHSFRDVPGVSAGAAVVTFVIMLAVRS